MKPFFRKSLINIVSGIILMAGLAACTGEKATTSYPVANLHPERISPLHIRQKAERKKSEAAPATVHHQDDFRLDISRLQPSETGYLVHNETGNRIFTARQYPSEAAYMSPDHRNLLASAGHDPDLSLGANVPSGFSYNPGIHEDSVSRNEKRSNNGSNVKQRRDRSEMNGFGIVSLVTGIASLVFPYLAPVAIVFGAIGLNKRQRGLAIAGMVLGIFTIVIYIVVILLLLIALSGPGI